MQPIAHIKKGCTFVSLQRSRNKTEQNMNTTEISKGQVLTITFITDYDLKATCQVLERKGTFAIILIHGKIERKKVYKGYDGSEYILPYGKYSMAPTARP